MNAKQIIVTKNSEEKEFYSEDKLRASLRSCGATKNQIDVIISQINAHIYNGITTNDIYKKAFSILKSLTVLSLQDIALNVPFLN